MMSSIIDLKVGKGEGGPWSATKQARDEHEKLCLEIATPKKRNCIGSLIEYF